MCSSVSPRQNAACLLFSWQATFDQRNAVLLCHNHRNGLGPSISQLVLCVDLDRQTFVKSPFALGTAYARLGLWSEAAEQFRAARESNPDNSVAKRWLDEIEAQRGMYHKQSPGCTNRRAWPMPPSKRSSSIIARPSQIGRRPQPRIRYTCGLEGPKAGCQGATPSGWFDNPQNCY